MKFVKLLLISILISNALIIYESKKSTLLHSEVRTTKGRSDSDGSIQTLSNHLIKCMKLEGLQGFKLNEATKGKLNFNFICEKSDAIFNSETKESHTKWITINRDLKDSTPLLANQEVKCEDGYGLQQFQIQYASKSIRYWFLCVRVQNLDCHAGASAESLVIMKDDHFARANSLKEQEIKLSPNQILTSFMLNIVEKKSPDNPK